MFCYNYIDMGAQHNFVDFYAMLGVAYDAESSEIKKAYLKQAKEAHPDAGGTTEAMQQLNHAYKTLTLPEKRAAYNKVYSLYNKVSTDNLDLKEDYYDIPLSANSGTSDSEDLEDFFVDQLYAEYYEADKKPKWKGKFKRK